MFNSKNTIKQSEITITPVKVKYAATYSRADDTIVENGITKYIFPGYEDISLDLAFNIKKEDIFIPKNLYSYDKYFGVRYNLLKNLYYQNYITGSLANSASYWDWNQQSTACSASSEYENRYIINDPPQSYDGNTSARLSYIYVPYKYTGEQISRKTFCLKPSTGNAYKIIDDGNGNLIDEQNNSVHVGNIIYSQGMIIITNQDYYQTIITP